MKLCLIEYVLDEVNLMYLQCVQKAMKKGIQHVLNLDEKSMSLGIRGFSYGKSRMHAGINVPSRVWEKALLKCKTRGNHHGIDSLYWVMIRLNDPIQEYHRK